MRMAASNLSNYINRSLNPQWNWSTMESEIKGLGCFLSPNEYYSQLMCFIEPSEALSKRMSSERLIEKAKDALFEQWQKYDPSSVQDLFANWSYGYARASGLVSVLSSVDEVASLCALGLGCCHIADIVRGDFCFGGVKRGVLSPRALSLAAEPLSGAPVCLCMCAAHSQR